MNRHERISVTLDWIMIAEVIILILVLIFSNGCATEAKLTQWLEYKNKQLEQESQQR